MVEPFAVKRRPGRGLCFRWVSVGTESSLAVKLRPHGGHLVMSEALSGPGVDGADVMCTSCFACC